MHFSPWRNQFWGKSPAVWELLSALSRANEKCVSYLCAPVCDVCVDVGGHIHAGACRSQTSTAISSSTTSLSYAFETWIDFGDKLAPEIHLTLLISSGIIGTCYCVWGFYFFYFFLYGFWIWIQVLILAEEAPYALTSPQMPNTNPLKRGNATVEGIQCGLRVFLWWIVIMAWILCWEWCTWLAAPLELTRGEGRWVTGASPQLLLTYLATHELNFGWGAVTM